MAQGQQAVQFTAVPAKVAVIGAGLLGIRIAGELALQGCTVRVYDENPVTLQTVHSTVAGHLEDLREAGLIATEQGLRGSVVVETIMSAAMADADVIIEAIIENLEVKNLIFRRIASVCSEDALLCTNTLSLDLEAVFADVPRQERTLGMRFLFPVFFINEVELSPYTATSEAAVTKACEFLASLRKSSFARLPGQHPRKLTMQEALEMQRKAAALLARSIDHNDQSH